MKQLMRALLWIVCYGGASWFVIKAKLGFNILSGNHWKLLFDKSVHAHWPTDMGDKKLVCKVLLSFIIIGVLGLSVAVKKKKTRIPFVKGELPPTKEAFRPTPMVSQGKMAAPAPTPAPVSGGEGNVPVLNTPPANLMGDVIRKITDVANIFDVSVFPHVKLENTFTQLVVSDDATALLLKILPQSGTWKVEKTEIPEESLWTLGEEQPKKVLKDIMDSTATLARLEPEAHSITVVLLAEGTIEDANEVKAYLEQNGIRIVALNNENMPEIPSWQDLLSEFYPVKEEEKENETDNTSQNV